MLLDTPGILWPKFEDPEVGQKLAAINGIKAERFLAEDIAFYLCRFLMAEYPDVIKRRYKLDEDFEDAERIFEAIGLKRGCFISGNEIDLKRVLRCFNS